MKCTEFEKHITEYVERTLDTVLSKSMREHIETCPECASLAAAHRAVFEFLNDTEPIAAPAGLAARIMTAVDTEAPETADDIISAQNPVDCGVFGAHIAAYIDGALDSEMAGNMNRHKAACASCGNLANAHELVMESLTSAEPVKAPTGLAARIITAVEREPATEKSPVIVGLYRKYGPLATITAAAISLAAASVIIIEGLAHILTGSQYTPGILGSVFAQITALPYLAQAWIAAMIPADYWPQINLLLKPIEIPYIGTSLPMFSLAAFFILSTSSFLYFSLSKSSYSAASSFENMFDAYRV